jgi:diaminopimelate decarboxylase
MSSHISPTLARLLPDSATLSGDDDLLLAGHHLASLAQKYGTPLYIFDRATIVHACARYREAFRAYYHASPVRMIYASKAYLSPLIARLMHEQEMGLDVVSGGELAVAQRANFPMSQISFHGNNKSEEELRMALRLGVGRIILDNEHELERLTRLAQAAGHRPPVLIRVAPDVETDTHRYLQTGHAAAKFGFSLRNGEAKAALLRLLHEDCLRVIGLHAHTGTMLREPRPYEECLERLFTLADEIYRETGWWPQEISPGGGWAVDTIEADIVPGIDILVRALQRKMEHLLHSYQRPAPTLVIEPGRSIIARAGVTLYRVGARKATSGGVIYVFVDGGMGDNIRPALYGAQYTAIPVQHVSAPASETVCVSGRYCESGDMLIESVALPRMHEGDCLLLPTTGAYCLPMASNYNLVPRPAVLLLDVSKIHIMEQRETYEDILARYPMTRF